MGALKDWEYKGIDLTCEGLNLADIPEKTKALYPYTRKVHKIANINYATCGVGIRERISIVDNAIMKASKV